ncbi:MAG: hypothetical protein WC637_14385 [Victivallales bacterium]
MTGKTLRYSFGRLGVLLCAGLMGLTSVGAGAPVPASPAAGVDIGKPALPAGQHPRVLFTAADLPAIRERIKDPVGAECWREVRGGAFGNSGEVLAELAKNSPEWVAKQKEDSKRDGLSSHATRCMNAAFVALVGEDQKDIDAAVKLMQIWLSAYSAEEAAKPVESWGCMYYALAYDWLYNYMSEADRAQARLLLGRMLGEPTRKTFDSAWYLLRGHFSGRDTTNWTPICTGHLGITALSIEGETKFNPEILPLAVKCTRAYLTDGITPDGAMYEGMNYGVGGYGTHTLPHLVLAMRRRGVDLLAGTHLSQVPLWVSYELLPWGGEANSYNKSAGQMGVGTFLPTFLAQEYDGLADYMFMNCSAPAPYPMRPEAKLALIHGIPPVKPASPAELKLPLSRWFSMRGMVFCRDGWGPENTHFSVNTNFIGKGHSHADHGTFCLASHGASFFADSGNGTGGMNPYASDAHNLVHIDGMAQSTGESAVESYIRSVETGTYTDVIDIDQKLAYSRVLSGSLGDVVRWKLYNPVQHADRRALFIRGATGALVLLTDQIQKDSRKHEYDWLGRSERNNNITVDGAKFQITERFGGKFMRSMTKGAVTTLEREKVDPGTYRGWALVRGEPGPPCWSSNTFAVNGKAAPYNTSYFGLGNFRAGWTWLQIKPDKKEEIAVGPDGKLKFEIRWQSGGRVALAVFSSDPKWEPGSLVPAENKDCIVLTASDVKEGGGDWQFMEHPKSVLDGIFLGPTSPALSVEPNFKGTGQPLLHAKLNAEAGRYLVLMVPHYAADQRTVNFAGDKLNQAATVKSAGGVDLLGGSVDGEAVTGELETDALAACVSYDASGKLLGYALINGTRLRCRGQVLLANATKPVQVTAGSGSFSLRAPGGAKADCDLLGAAKVTVNGSLTAAPAGKLAALVTPELPKTWQVDVSPDGRIVTVKGDGPQPLLVKAPLAVDCIVNGVSRYFCLTPAGEICPTLSQGTGIYETIGEIKAEALVSSINPSTPAELANADLFDPSAQGQKILLAKGAELRLKLPLPGLGVYRLQATVAADAAGELNLTLNGQPLGAACGLPKNKSFATTASESFIAADATAELAFRLSGGGSLALLNLILIPELKPVTEQYWTAIGPFPTPWSPAGDSSGAAVLTGLTTVYPPEKNVDLYNVCKLADKRELRWHLPTPEENSRKRDNISFTRRLGVMNGQICYGVTTVVSPAARSAQLAVECDYWANVWVNGTPVTSTRDKGSVAADGAQFNGWPYALPVQVMLKKGDNQIMVKCHGGSGSSYVRVMISDPGDLKFSAPGTAVQKP